MILLKLFFTDFASLVVLESKMIAKSLDDIRSDIANLTNDIKDLDPEGKVAAMKHMKETICLLKLGSDLVTYDSEVKEEKLWFGHENSMVGVSMEEQSDDVQSLGKNTPQKNGFLPCPFTNVCSPSTRGC